MSPSVSHSHLQIFKRGLHKPNAKPCQTQIPTERKSLPNGWSTLITKEVESPKLFELMHLLRFTIFVVCMRPPWSSKSWHCQCWKCGPFFTFFFLFWLRVRFMFLVVVWQPAKLCRSSQAIWNTQLQIFSSYLWEPQPFQRPFLLSRRPKDGIWPGSWFAPTMVSFCRIWLCQR